MSWCFNGLMFYLYKEREPFSIHFHWFLQEKNMKLWLREVFLLNAMLLRASHSVRCGTFIEGLHTLSFNQATYFFTVQSNVKLIQWHCLKFQGYFDFFLKPLLQYFTRFKRKQNEEGINFVNNSFLLEIINKIMCSIKVISMMFDMCTIIPLIKFIILNKI